MGHLLVVRTGALQGYKCLHNGISVVVFLGRSFLRTAVSYILSIQINIGLYVSGNHVQVNAFKYTIPTWRVISSRFPGMYNGKQSTIFRIAVPFQVIMVCHDGWQYFIDKISFLLFI